MSSAGPETPSNGQLRHRIVEQTKHSLERLGQEVRQDTRSPMVGAALAGAAVVGAALLFGLPEALLGAIAGAWTYRTLRSRTAPAGAPTPGR